MYGLIEGAHWGWTDPKTLATIGGGVVVLALFGLWELRTHNPMLEVRLFKNRTFTASSIGITLVFLTMFGFFFVVSQLFQLVLGYGPFESGIRMLPITVFFMVFTPMSERAVAHLGVRRVVIPGMIATAAGIFIISLLTADSSYLHVVAGHGRDVARHVVHDDADDHADHGVGAAGARRHGLGDERHHP